jgi:hypothetical protein
VDERGRAIAQAPISARAAGLPIASAKITAGRTDGDGNFSLELEPLDTELTIFDPRCGVASDFLPGDPPRRRGFLRQTVHLAPGEHKDLQLTLAPLPTYSVAGVVRSHVDPFPGAVISLSMPGVCGGFGEGMPASGGTLFMDGIPPGEYRLKVTLHRNIGDCDTCSEAPIYSVVRDLKVVQENVTLPAIDVFPGLDITGRIHWEKLPGRGGGLYITMIDSMGLVHYPERDGNQDSFSLLHLQPDHYNLKVQPGGGVFALREARLDGQVIDLDEIVVTPEMRKAQLDLYIQ